MYEAGFGPLRAFRPKYPGIIPVHEEDGGMQARVSRPSLDTFTIYGAEFDVLRPSRSELSHVKHILRRARTFGQIGAALEAVVVAVLGAADREVWDGFSESDEAVISFRHLRTMAPWVAETLADHGLARLITKACGRLDARVDKINERQEARIRCTIDRINERNDQLVRRALQRSLGRVDSPQVVHKVVASHRCSWGRSHIARVPRRTRPVRRVSGSRDSVPRRSADDDPQMT